MRNDIGNILYRTLKSHFVFLEAAGSTIFLLIIDHKKKRHLHCLLDKKKKWGKESWQMKEDVGEFRLGCQ
jgi:hypothetical protein